MEKRSPIPRRPAPAPAPASAPAPAPEYIPSTSTTPPSPSSKSIISIHDEKHQQQPEQSEDNDASPPPYHPITLIENQIDTDQPRRSRILPIPLVIPQTSHTLHGSIYRPFTRAYAPHLASHGIPRSDFLSFIDGLNNAWLAHPYLQAVSTTSHLLNLLPLLETQIAGLGMSVAAEYGSIKLSQARTQAYLRIANESLFAPKGLRVQILKTAAMLDTIGVESDTLELPPLRGESGPGEEEPPRYQEREREEGGDGGEGLDKDKDEDGDKVRGNKEQYDPQVRRLEALAGHVLPIRFDGERTDSDNWLKRVTAKQERWFTTRQNTGLGVKRDKAARMAEKAERAGAEIDARIAEVEAVGEGARERARERLAGPLGESLQGRGIVRDDLDKELRGVERRLEKLRREREAKVTRVLVKSEKRVMRVEKRETKIAQKVMWVVVTGDDAVEGEFVNHLYEDEDDDDSS
ncbi:hypothetical protein P168DRAFT_306225 [Aspergillus campestris IBT 28561]|uniref:Uncharacterized protein n=1 Tax=Aspergillus campestris (strain IBT 28561) TaxID=1392248 RepID=A0A2I1CWJ3_ASPC2|nr:uncharacterized protein P168DRAFT_306225 [Aspergillus campestris IBT 28561]PKY01994.1 hypothetical protein P168DRAFT_306225 [Aspergillus campestris IBT 28561]